MYSIRFNGTWLLGLVEIRQCVCVFFQMIYLKLFQAMLSGYVNFQLVC